MFQSQVKTIFEGTLSETGTATVNTNLNENNTAPGMLKANFTTKVFEAGGNFSIDNFSIPYNAEADLAYVPEFNLEKGIMQTLKWYKLNNWL